MFLRHPRQVLTRSAIFEHVWGYDFGSSSNSLGVYMGYLRRKTEVGEEPRLLHTVRGVGYVLRDAAMSFRRRITLVSAAAVAIAVVLASLLTYVLTSTSCTARSTRSCATAPTACDALAADPERSDARHAARPLERHGLDSRARDGRAARQRLAPRQLPPRPDQVRGYQQLVDATARSLVPLGERDAAGRRAHARARRARRQAFLPRRAPSTASTCACSPSRSATAAPCSSPSR